MSSPTTTRYTVKAKSLTLFELCQTINVLQRVPSRNTAQILTRRLYLHPLTISTNAKRHSSKVIANNIVDIEEFNQTIAEKKQSPLKHKRYCDLSVFSSPFPLSTRSNTKVHSSVTTDRDSSTDFETSSTNNSINHVHLPALPRKLKSTSSKRTVLTQSSLIPIRKKPKPIPKNEPVERIDVWRHLAHALQRPAPKDPPTTPLDILPDSDFQDVPQTNCNSIQQIQIYQRKPTCDPVTDDDEEN